MSEIPEELVRTILRAGEINPFWRLLGIRIDEIRKGYCKGHVEINDQHKQLAGLVHGGVHASLADSLAWIAVVTHYAPKAVNAVTVELKINYLRPVSEGTLWSTAEVIYGGRSVAVIDSNIYNGNKLVGKSLITYQVRFEDTDLESFIKKAIAKWINH